MVMVISGYYLGGGEEERTEVGEQSVIRGIRAGSLYVKKIPQHLFERTHNNNEIE